MLLDRNTDSKEEVIKFLTFLGFKFIEKNYESLQDYYQYKGNNLSIRVVLDVADIEIDGILELGTYNEYDNQKEYLSGKEAIDFLNDTFKHILRKLVIEKMLKEDEFSQKI